MRTHPSATLSLDDESLTAWKPTAVLTAGPR
jgi:hypothetical protein